MSPTNLLTAWPGNPVISILLLVFISVIILYMARRSAHYAIRSLCNVIQDAMRIAANSVMLSNSRLVDRNKEVLLAAGEDAVERLIEREFHRVDAVVSRDLSGYPTLQRALKDQITRIDEDYRESGEVPPSPPAWDKAVEAVAKIRPTGDNMVTNILEEINKSINKQHKIAISEYRKVSGERHSLLKKMMPYWRKMAKTLDDVEKTISGLLERSKVIDSKMEQYEQIRKKKDKAVRMLSSSSLTQFFIACFVLLIAIGGAVINFNLIALPMSEMVGGSSYIGPYRTSDVAAMVIILVEVAMGLFLMESLRITRLFPIIGSMDDRMRNRMLWITFSILFILASVESSLAYMRDIIATDMQALRQSLAEVTITEPIKGSWIPTVGQMVMGFILPFALTFVAIPLESFINSSRTILGILAVGFLRGVAFVLGLAGNLARSMGDMMIHIYDLIIFGPLWVEGLIRNKAEKTKISQVEEEVIL